MTSVRVALGFFGLATALVGLSIPARGEVVYATSFDTAAFGLTETLPEYGLTNTAIVDASVFGGIADLVPPDGFNGSLDLGAFSGDLRITTGVTTSGSAPLTVNVGLRVGNNNYIFHPGFVAGMGAFRIDGPGGHGNAQMGFTPDRNSFSTMTVTIDSLTGSTEISVVDGSDPNLVYTEVFLDADYSAGVTPIGLSTGSTAAPSHIARFDYVTVESLPVAVPVPVGGPLALLALAVGLPSLGVLVLRSAASIRRG